MLTACRPAAERLLAGHADPPSMPSALDALLTAVEERFPGQQVVDESRRLAAAGLGW